MRPLAAIAVSTLAMGGLVAMLATGHASDHLDGPRSVADPQADIADVFAFTSPTNPNRVVLAMTLRPYAPSAATFSPGIDYVFRIRRVIASQPLTLDPAALDIVCDFDDGDSASQTATCSMPGGASATAVFGDPDAGNAQNNMRVFVGRRADPAFFDRAGAQMTMASGRASFTGQNAFAGADVLAIVVEMEAAMFTDAGGAPLLAVAAETIRRNR
jgi:hypothetical protein